MFQQLKHIANLYIYEYIVVIDVMTKFLATVGVQSSSQETLDSDLVIR